MLYGTIYTEWVGYEPAWEIPLPPSSAHSKETCEERRYAAISFPFSNPNAFGNARLRGGPKFVGAPKFGGGPKRANAETRVRWGGMSVWDGGKGPARNAKLRP